MAEPVDRWWARRQFSRGTEVPYPVGTYREAWAPFPVLIRQDHPDLNAGITLTQIPPAAEVLLQWQCDVGHIFVATPAEQRDRPGQMRRRSVWCPECLQLALGRRPSSTAAPSRPKRVLCEKTPALPVGEAFVSECAPRPASAIEAELRAGLQERLMVTHGTNAIRAGRPFFDHLEVWPDILLPELRVAVEYDSTGRHGLEHVGRRQKVDERKDRIVRSAGWDVIRVRTGRLELLNEHDVLASGVTGKTFSRLVDELRALRGSLLVDAYLL
ncbi:hypothetical protein ACFOYW_17455 [Gryllotalpicola reticulitermitis]|uniref:Zinc-ribbon domain-containing protein n=1 Tax=Gryllotalpicola reticulitermitis TaxID=1184153 RepID=A0ABV8QBU8_9MICO